MLENLQKFIKGIFSVTYKKEDLIKRLLLLESMLNDNTIYIMDEILDSLKSTNPTSKQESRLSPIFKNIGLKHHTDLSVSLKELRNFAADIDGTLKNMRRYIDDLEDVITDKTMTGAEAGVIGTLSNFESMVEYLTDLAYFISYIITDSEGNLTKVVTVRITEGSLEFHRLYRKYKDNTSTIVRNIQKLSKTPIHDAALFKMSATKIDNSFPLPFNGLTINPFYYLGTLFVDIEMLYYDYLKYKKELIEFKIKEREFSDDPSTKKQIEYYEKKLAEIEAKLSAIKEGYDD
jgi:hypothetical protein